MVGTDFCTAFPTMLTEIGPDFGEGGWKWRCGVRAKNGNIYCAPYDADHILKININDGTVETLDNVELPDEWGDYWSGALAIDGCIYFMPSDARRILKLNPDNDTLPSVGDDLGEGGYSGTVVGNDDFVYGIPYQDTRIIKFDPTNLDTTSTVVEEAERGFDCGGNGVLAGDGYIYAMNQYGQVLQVDTTSNNYTWIGDRIYSGIRGKGWGDPIIGVDKCIYWPPSDPSLVGDDLGGTGSYKWQCGALATDGTIYCIPYCSSVVLVIDPFKEFSATLQTNMTLYPDVWPYIFEGRGRRMRRNIL